MKTLVRKQKEKEEFRLRKIKLSKLDAVWLAGVIDGEGSVGLYDFGKEGRRVEVQVSNINKEFIKKVRSIIGCGSSVTRHVFHSSHKGRKPVYHYSLKGSIRCYWVLKQIAPFLVIKKKKALSIMKEIESKPFGRWKNSTESARKKQSLLTKLSWQDPMIRLRRINSIKRRIMLKNLGVLKL